MSKKIKSNKIHTKMQKKPTFSHDSFFKLFYSDPKLAQELFQLVFSKAELKAYDLKKLKVEKDTFEDKRADLVYSVPLKSYPKFKLKIFILLEHKSYYDKNLFNQLLEYQVLIRQHSIQHLGRPMPVIPVLFYHGKQSMKWKKFLQEEDFEVYFPKIPMETRKIMLNYGLKIIDTQDPKIQKTFKDRNFKSRGVIKLLSEIWSIKKPVPSKVKEVFIGFEDILKNLKAKKKKNTGLRILEYLIDNTDIDSKTWEEAEKLIIKEGILIKGGVMDIMDVREIIKEKGRYEGRKEGRHEGRKEGRHEIILNMLKNKVDIALISKVTSLSKKEINKLKKSYKSS